MSTKPYQITKYFLYLVFSYICFVVHALFGFQSLFGFTQINLQENAIVSFNDSLKSFTVVYRENRGFVAIDPDGKELFTIFPFDNGPDYPSEGLFRIIENNKIGFANLAGEIVVNPQFTAALPFHDGLAAFCNDCRVVDRGEHRSWEGGSWGFIDSGGAVVIPPQYDRIINDFRSGIALVEQKGIRLFIDKRGKQIVYEAMKYKDWVKLLGEAARIINRIVLQNKLTITLEWIEESPLYSFYNKDSAALKIKLSRKNNKSALLQYLVVPWQNFFRKQQNFESANQGVFDNLLTVTEFAVIFSSGVVAGLSGEDLRYTEAFDRTIKRLIDYEANQTVVQDINLNLPANIQIITLKVFPYYIDLQIAIPGSRLPELSRWGLVSENRMLFLHLIPDQGEVKSNGIEPANPYIDTYFTSVEKEMLNIFFDALENYRTKARKREVIYNNALDKMKPLFSAASSYVNFLYDKYAKMLDVWLVKGEEKPRSSYPDNLFPDYEPKRTPDTVTDYMPQLIEEIERLPAVGAENLAELITQLLKYKASAEKNPGKWEEGNIVLGAKPQEYRPSPEELLASEIGDRIRRILNSISKKQLHQLLEVANSEIEKIEYTRFIFTHVDVLGSGRFFYVDSMEKVELRFK